MKVAGTVGQYSTCLILNYKSLTPSLTPSPSLTLLTPSLPTIAFFKPVEDLIILKIVFSMHSGTGHLYQGQIALVGMGHHVNPHLPEVAVQQLFDRGFDEAVPPFGGDMRIELLVGPEAP